MGQDRKPPGETPKLREKAEARLQSEARGMQEYSLDDLHVLMHELQVHQIELEMQNDELRQGQISLEEANRKYRDFYDFSPLGFLTLDESGLIREVNLTAASQLGITRRHLADKPFRFFIAIEDRDRFRLYLKRVFQEPGPQPGEIKLQRPDGGSFFARLYSVAVTSVSGARVCRTSITDISDLKQAEEKLQASERLFASFLGHLPSVAVIRDHEGRYLFANAAWEQAFQKRREEWLGKTFEELWPPEVAAKFREQDRLVIESREALQTLGSLPHPDGLHQWIFHRFPIADQDGQPVMIGINAIDVTEPMATKARLEQVLDSGPAVIYTCEAGGDFAPSYISGNIKTLAGWEARDFLTDPRFWLQHLHPDDRPRVLEQLEYPWQEDHQSLEYRFLAQDGAYRWMHDEVRLVPDAGGKPVEMAGVWMDITARRQVEDALRESKEKYHNAYELIRLLIDTAPDLIWAKDMHDRFMLVNQAMCRKLLRCDHPEEAVGKTDMFFAEQERNRGQEHTFGELCVNSDAIIKECKTPGLFLESGKVRGDSLTLHVHKAPLLNQQGEMIGTVGCGRDITKEQAIEAALKASEHHYRLLVNQIPAVVFKGYRDWSIDFFDNKIEEVSGYSKEEFDSRQLKWCDLILPEDLDMACGLFEQALKTDKSYVREYRLRKKTGEIAWIQARGQIFCDAAGQVDFVSGVFFDITAHKQAEEALKETEHQYRLLVNQIPAVVFTGYSDWKVDFLDRKVEELTGYKKEDFDSGKIKWCDVIHEDDFDYAQRVFIEALKTDKSYVREHRIRRKDGTIRWVQCRGQIFCDAEGKVDHISGVSFDITARKALEAQLLQAQKMEAVGRLAGGVAHDFNNLLMAIMGYGELIRTSLMKDDPLYKYSEDILKASERAASLTQQLLAFSRRQVMQPQVLNLNRLAADLEQMLRRLIGEHIDLEIVAGPDLGAVTADPGQINQIIMNLAVNARDAMPTGGRLILATDNIEFAASHECYSAAAPPGRYVRLAVTDTGGGIDAETLDHIFEPFFTTKEVGKGTGLGLPIVYSIVKQNRGYIKVDSLPGQGATFKIYLPRIEAAVEAPGSKVSLAAKLEGSETILVVEDEDALRTLLCRFFGLYGYNVLEARHGGEALLICERHPGPIHLMVTDVVMPQMSGKELAGRLALLHPEMAVFFMSGYTDRDLTGYGAPESNNHFIPKPFRPMDLVKKVRDFLDASGGGTAESPPP
jgi:two-component system, cell cycle sensor histidine kinase and response regulator CckA